MHIPQLNRTDSHGFSRLEAATFKQTSLHVRSDAQISLVTAQGDKVTLSASSSLQATHLTYDYFGRIPGQTITARAEKFEMATRNEFAMTIQGDLDEEELADIRKLIETIRGSAADVLSGRPDALPESTLDITDLESIAGFQAELTYTREALAIRADSVAARGTEGAASGAAIAPSATRPRHPTTDSLLDELVKAAKRWEDEKTSNKLPRRFARLLEKLARDIALDEPDRKLTAHILSELRKARPKASFAA